MLQPPRMVSYQVGDLQKAKDWYTAMLGQGPAFDSPMACVFSVGECSLALLPSRERSEGASGGVSFWTVDDIDGAYRRLVQAGAEPVTEITLLMLRSRIARLRDPFGNVIGLISASDRRTSVEDRPSESALTVAFCRALATRETREEIRGPDTLAELFVAVESRKSLGDPAARAWLIERFGGTYEFFIARTAYGDGIFRQALQDRVPQIVLLGAGYDTRAYRFRDSIQATRVFELDALPTQQRKRQLLEGAGIAPPPQLVHVPVNFEKQSPGEALADAGFDRRQKTLFVWEGVTYYLSEEAIEATLAFVRDGSPRGSALCFDYMVKAPDMESRHGVKEVFEAWRRAYSSEEVRFGIDEGAIGAFLSERGFRLVENLAPEELERRFLRLNDGSLAGRVVALFNVALAEVATGLPGL
ncbi:MAG TPA: SAM-dependent methyltransferase [Vicinamibacteria bacterium]|nr:SAM-dependent methyltransferase [Vicinamibacteria bacterium]